MVHIPAATPETTQLFAYPHPQKPVRFPAGQSEYFHPAKPSFYPPAVTAGITLHFALQSRVPKGYPLWKPLFCREVGTACIGAAVPLPSKTK